MQQIIVFTELESLRKTLGLSKYDETPTIFRNIIFNRDNSNQQRPDIFSVYFDKNKFLNTRTIDTNNKKIYLISDNITQEQFASFINNVNDKLYILKHTIPNLDFGKHIVKNGRHDPKNRDGKFYPDVFDILQDDKENKFDRIFNLVFKQELNAYISFYKLLSLLPLKLKQWEEKKFEKAFNDIKSKDLIKDYKAEIDKIKISFIENKNQFLKQLEAENNIVDKIKKLSSND